MFEKVNPYLKNELSDQAVAHFCGCRCYSGGGTITGTINIAKGSNTCFQVCESGNSANYDANYIAAYNDKKY